MKKLLFFLFVIFSLNMEADTYLRTFNVVRIVNVSNTTQLINAVNAAQSGDDIVLSTGTYTTNLSLSVANVRLRCATFATCDFVGLVDLNGVGDWVQGIYFKPTVTDPIIDMNAANQVVVNNVIKGTGDASVGIGTWNTANHLVYNNYIFESQHGVYAQNTAPAFKYIVQNVIMDLVAVDTNKAVVHGYAEAANKTENMILDGNVTKGNRLLIGGQINATPPLGNIVKNGIFFQSNLDLGFRRPNDTDVLSNLFFYSEFIDEWIFGHCEQVYNPSPIDIKFNTFYNPSGKKVRIRTSAYCPGRIEGFPDLRSDTTMDYNTYRGQFDNAIYAHNIDSPTVQPIGTWRSQTETDGKRFDQNSTHTSLAPVNGYRRISNEFDPSRFILVVWAFPMPTQDYITVVGLPAGSTLHDIKDPDGAPLMTVGPSNEISIFLGSNKLLIYHGQYN